MARLNSSWFRVNRRVRISLILFATVSLALLYNPTKFDVIIPAKGTYYLLFINFDQTVGENANVVLAYGFTGAL
jgi:hypothetical protein